MQLNEAQRRVLRWVATGYPDGVMEGYSHRVSAAALRSCGLVRITGRGQSWRAELTDAGRALVDRRHTADFFSMTEVERSDADQLLRVLRNEKTAQDTAIVGFNIG